MIPRFFYAIPALLLLSVCSCNHQAPSESTILPPVTNIAASLNCPTQIKPLTNVPLILTLKDSQTGKPVDGGKGMLSLAMPSMTMPMNTVHLTDTQHGIYKGTGVFTMAGSWSISAVVLLPDGREWGKSFPVKVE